MDPSYRDTYEQFFQQYQLFRYAHRPDRQYRYANPVLDFYFPYSEQTDPENGRTDDVF